MTTAFKESVRSRFLCTGRSPQAIIFLIEDSRNMAGARMQKVHEAIHETVMYLQASNCGVNKTRYLVSVIRFGDSAENIAGPCKPEDLNSSAICAMLPSSDGKAELAEGLRMAKKDLEVSLRTIAADAMVEPKLCPGPLVLVITSGIYTGGSPLLASRQLSDVTTPNEPVSVIVMAAGAPQGTESDMMRCASRTELFMQLCPEDIPSFFAEPPMS